MPIYEHKCLADECGYEWEDMYKISTDAKDVLCPNCKTVGKAKRLISLVAPGRVELTGQELQQQLKVDAKKMKARAAQDENYRASLIGEDKYNESQTSKTSIEKDLVKIGKDASKAKNIKKATK